MCKMRASPLLGYILKLKKRLMNIAIRYRSQSIDAHLVDENYKSNENPKSFSS